MSNIGLVIYDIIHDVIRDVSYDVTLSVTSHKVITLTYDFTDTGHVICYIIYYVLCQSP